MAAQLGVEPSRIQKDFVGNQKAAELLGVSRGNVHKTLSGHGVEGDLVWQGKRRVHIYRRSEVNKVARDVQKNSRARKRRDGETTSRTD